MCDRPAFNASTTPSLDVEAQDPHTRPGRLLRQGEAHVTQADDDSVGQPLSWPVSFATRRGGRRRVCPGALPSITPCAMIAGMSSVLLLSSNGAGMGHLTRLLAYARRMPPEVRRHVVSLSQAVPVVEAEGLPWEYLASQGASGLRPAAWRRLFAEQVAEVLHRVDPRRARLRRDPPLLRARRGPGQPPPHACRLVPAGHVAGGAQRRPARQGGVVRRGGRAGRPVGGRRPRGHRDGAGGGGPRVAPGDPAGPGGRRTTAPPPARPSGCPPRVALALVSLGAGNINDTDDEVGAAAAALTAAGHRGLRHRAGDRRAGVCR